MGHIFISMRPHKTILKNGLRILTIPRKESLSVNVMVMVDAGGKDEDKKINGISHFLEHMCFKGTKKRPTSLKLSSEFDSLGANSNALTSHDWTGYYATVTPDHADKVVELIADLYLNPIYPEAEVKKEKGVIKEEIKLHDDKPTSLVWDVFTKACFGDTPPGWTVLGTSDVIDSLGKKDLLDYRKKYYFAENTLVIVAGKFDEKKMIKLLARQFSSIPGRKNQKKEEKKDWTKLGFQGPKVVTHFRKLDQTHLILGFPNVNSYSDKTYPLMVLAGVLGGGMSSRLFQKIREEMGAAYYVGAVEHSYSDHGYLALYAGVDSSKSEKVVKTMIAECEKLKTRLVPEAELKRVKDNMIGSLYLSLETPSDLGYYYGEQEILKKKILSPEELAEKIRKVKPEEIRQLAREFLVTERLNLALVGPHGETKSFLPLLRLK